MHGEDMYSQRNSAFRFSLTDLDDTGDMQMASMQGFQNAQQFTQVMRVQSHGLSSIPPKGAHGVALPFGQRMDNLAVFGGEDPTKRPKNLGAGNTALYNADGTLWKMVGKDSTYDQQGNHVWTCKSLTIKCGDVTVLIDGSGLHITGGQVDHNKHDIGSDHKHTNSGGAGLGGPPQ